MSEFQSYRAFSYRGDLYQIMGKYDMALMDYESIIKLLPLHIPTFSSIGSCYKNLNEFDKAITYFERILSFDKSVRKLKLN